MSVEPSDLQAIFDRIKSGTSLSQQDLDILTAAVQAKQITIATGDRAALHRLRAVRFFRATDEGARALTKTLAHYKALQAYLEK